MTKLPYMQVWVGDLLSSTMHLSLEQRGGYILLMLTMWNGGGSLPSDPAKLARICGISLKRWQHISPEILEFFEVAGERITQKRLAAEHQKQLEIIEKKSAAGKLGNLAKSLKSNNTVSASAVAKVQGSERISEINIIFKSQNKKEKGRIYPFRCRCRSLRQPVVKDDERDNQKPKRRISSLSSANSCSSSPTRSTRERQSRLIDERGGRPRHPNCSTELCATRRKSRARPSVHQEPPKLARRRAWKNPQRPSAGGGHPRDQQFAQVAGFLPRSS